jgi:serine/threonine protein kinase
MIGRRFGNYVVRMLLGRGSMSAVYLAEHPGLDRRVAVKVLAETRSRETCAVRRFLNEGRATCSIQHPAVVDILDMGMTLDGLRYIIMECLIGESLAGRITRTGPLPVANAVRLFRDAAAGLGAAHAKGIIHRDLKPENLFLMANAPGVSSPERIKVLDFGIAKVERSRALCPVRTDTGLTVGTPPYMSPEQCCGSRDIDRRSDVYSLGVVLYESLCGKQPFVSPYAVEVLTMHLMRQVPSVRAERPEIPAALEAVVLRMLAKDRQDRYQTMGEVELALDEVARTLAPPVAPLEEATIVDQPRSMAQ